MPGYDGEIKLGVKLDTSKTKSSTNELSRNIEKAFSSADPKIRNMGLQMEKLNDRIRKTAREMQELGKQQIPTQQFQELNKSIDTVTKNLERAKTRMQDMRNSGKDQVYTNEYRQLLADRDWVSKKINSLENKTRLSASQKTELSGLRQELRDIKGEIKAVEDSGEAFQKSPAFLQKEQEAQRLSDRLDELKAKSQEMQNAGQAMISGKDTTKYQLLEQSLGHMTTQAGILNQRFQEATTGAGNLTKRFSQLSTTVGSAFKKLGNFIKSHVTKGANDAHKSFGKLFRQVLKYGLGVRSLFILYRKLRAYATQAFKDMASQYPEINTQLSDLISHFDQFKHSIATALQPLLNIVLPILNTIIDAFITAANAVGSFFAALTGQGFIYKAVKQQKNFAGAVGGTGSAAKEAKEELAEYDKLVVISSNDAGGGGGGGGGAGGGGSFFEQTPIDSGVEGLINKIKRMWREADFTELGEELGQKIINALNSIPWDKVKETAYKLGRSIATFLNGLISPELFESLAHTVAEALNTAFLFLKTFGETFEWKEFGESIGRGITKFFRDADFAMWGDTVHTWIAGILDAGIALVDNTDWALLGTRIGEFIANLDIPDLVGKLAKLAFKIISGLAEALLNLGKESPLAAAIIALLTTIVVAGKLGGLAAAISEALGAELVAGGITLGGALPVILAAGVLFHITKIIWKYANGEYDSVQDLFYDLIFDKPVNISRVGDAPFQKPEKPDENGGMRNYYTDKYGLTTPEVWDEYERELAEWEKKYDRIQKKFNPNYTTTTENNGMANYYTNKYGLTHADLTGNKERTEQAAKNKEIAKIQGEEAKARLEAYKSAKKIISDQNEIDSILFPIFDAVKGFGKKLFGSGATTDTSGMEAAIGMKAKDLFKTENIYKGLDKNKKAQGSLSKSSKKIYDAVTSPFKESGQWAKDTVDNIIQNFAKLPTDVQSKFKDTYINSTDEFKGINQWAKNVERDTVSGFNTLPGDVEQKYRSANRQGRSQFDGSKDWAKALTTTIGEGFSGLSGQVQPHYKKAYTDGTNAFANAGSWAKSTVITIDRGFDGLPVVVGGQFRSAYSTGTSEFNNAGSWAKTVVNNINGGLSGLPTMIQNRFKAGYDGAKTESNNFKTWIKQQDFTAKFKIDVPSQNWLQNQYNALAGIWGNQEASFTITAIGDNQKIQSFVDRLNNIIGQVNSSLISFDRNARLLSKIRVPKAAKGAVIPPNQRFLAMLGDQTQGTNIETPLSTMVEAFEMALANGAGAGASTVNVNIDGRQVAQVVWDANERRYKQTGRS